MDPLMWIGVAVAVLLLGGLAGWAVWRRRIPAAPQLPPGLRTQHPIALLHGAFGFDEIVVREQRHAYFRGVSQRLEEHGIVVFRPTVAPVAGISRRAQQLADQIRALPPGRVNLIAHSMGGLDARYAIAHLGLADRVASLVTLGTPHLGTPLADVGHAVSSRLGLSTVLRHTTDLLADLTTAKMRAFNRDVPDDPGVFYGSVVCRIAPGGGEMNPILAPTHALLKRQQGDNDGLVPVRSQEWGEVLLIVDADHWAQVGWSGTVDTPAIYEAIAQALHDRGL